jgi:hypothetical protein
MTDVRRQAIEEAEAALRISEYGATWTLTLEELWDKAVDTTRRAQRVEVNNVSKNIDRIADSLHGFASDLRDLHDTAVPPST